MAWGRIVLAVGLALSSAVVSLAITVWIVVRLPEDYFLHEKRNPAVARTHPTLVVVKNLLGGIVVLLGLLLSVPGVPGQGLLTMLVGVLLLDFPGKYRVERALLGSGRVLRVANRLRAAFGRPAFRLE